MSLWCQHMNLFGSNLSQYNFMMILYINLLVFLKLLSKFREHWVKKNPCHDNGLIKHLKILKYSIYLGICYLALNMYQTYSNVKILILLYYYIHKIIIKFFIEKKRTFLSIKSDFFRH